MDWRNAEELLACGLIEDGERYLVITNGGEWRDNDLCVMRGMEARLKLGPRFVRGRPVWMAKIVRPDLTFPDRPCGPVSVAVFDDVGSGP